jgi:hypothetical protein
MQNNNNQRKHSRGSSPSQVTKQGFDTWVRRLRSIQQVPENSTTPIHELEMTGNQSTELVTLAFSSQQQSYDEGRWQDDGGEGG